jgi:hypothetical protein
MRKITFLLGAGVGFVLGSKAGSAPYQQLESKVRQVSRRPEVREAVDQLAGTAKDQAAAVTEKVGDKLPSSGASSRDEADRSAADRPGESYVDPQDLQFGQAAAEKEAALDAMLEQGVPLERVEAQEEELRSAGQMATPRAGNKAKPVSRA